jgi:pilus assembly protein CpaF
MHINDRMQALIEDESVSEIMVDSPERVYVERLGKLEDVAVAFASEKEVLDWVNGLLAASGCAKVSAERPWVEGRLRDGNYLVAAIPPVAVNGIAVVLHKYMRPSLTFEQLLGFGSLSPMMLDFLKAVMCTRLNILVAGGNASGKNTLARLLADLVPEHERMIILGQDFFLQILCLHRRHQVCLESTSYIPGGTAPTMSDLFRLARRLRPDRIIAGDLSGVEVKEAIDLMNSGHDATLITMHASSPRDALFRLEMMMTQAEPGLALPAIRAQIAAAFDLIVYGARLEDGSRKITAITQVQGMKGDNILLQDLFTWEKTGISEDGQLNGRFTAAGAIPSFDLGRSPGLIFPPEMFMT